MDFVPENVLTALDIGCGDGKITKILSKARQIDVWGLDGSWEALKRCEFNVINGRVSQLPFQDDSFDLVMSTDVFEHLPDDVEQAAWQEAFRVASTYLMIAVPFREELLEGTACCRQCGNKYHVNWHLRAYDYSELLSRVSHGWDVEALILTGGAWSAYHPREICFRRKALNEWNGWTESVCPICGAQGCAPDDARNLSPNEVESLGNEIYQDIIKNGAARQYSEIVVLYRKENAEHSSPPVFSPAQNIIRNACLCDFENDPEDTNLLPFPESAHKIKVETGYVVQFPVYDKKSFLDVYWKKMPEMPIHIDVEDNKGLLFSGEIKPMDGLHTHIKFQREIVSSYYGVLLRLGSSEEILTLQLGNGPEGLFLTPGSDTGRGSYHAVSLEKYPLFLQVPRPCFIGAKYLDRRTESKTRLYSIFNLFSRLSRYE